MTAVVFWTCVIVVAYTYIGYPLLVHLVSRLRPPQGEWPDYLPRLTLIIAAYNEEAVIARKVEESLELDYPRNLLQVLVVTDGSNDATPDIVSRYAHRGIELVHRREPPPGKMAASNRAVRFARGEVVVFSDANNRYHPQALRQMAAPFADPDVGAVTGRKTVVAEDGLGYSEGLYWRYESKIRQAETRLGSTVGVNGEIFAIRRSLFAPAPKGVINDDAWMAQRVVRLGHRVVYNPDAISTERVSATAADEVLRRTRMVAGQYQTITRLHEWPWGRPVVLWELVSHKVLRPMVPFGMLGALAATVISLFVPGEGLGQAQFITFTFPVQWLAAAAQIAFDGLAASGRRASGAAAKITYVPCFLVDSNIAALKGLARFLTGEQPAAWEKVARRDEAPRIAA